MFAINNRSDASFRAWRVFGVAPGFFVCIFFILRQFVYTFKLFISIYSPRWSTGVLGLLPFPFFLLADDIFDSSYFMIDDVLKLTTSEEDSTVSSFKVSLLGVAHLGNVVKKFFRCHVLLILVLHPWPRTDFRTLGGAYVRFPLPPCHRRRRLSACSRNTP